MRKERKARRVDPEAARQRRMATYSAELHTILEAAKSGVDWTKQFDDHNYATAFLARYYRFRIDAIECRVPGSLAMRDMYVSGKDALGATFNTRTDGVLPYTITWKYVGSGEIEHARIEEGEVRAKAAAQPGPQGDEAERLIEQWVWGKNGTAERKDFAEIKITSECLHEWDSMEVMCLKCGKPFEAK